MMKIANLKIGKRLALGFGMLCLALVLLVGQATIMLGRVNAGTDELANRRIPRIEMVNTVLAKVNDVAIALRNMMLTTDAADRTKQADQILALRADLANVLGQLDKTLQAPDARANLARLVELNGKYVKGQQDLMGLVLADNADGAKAYLGNDLRPVLVAYKKTIQEQIGIQSRMASEKAAEAQDMFEQTRLMMIVLGGVTLLGAAALGWWITTSITRPLNRAVSVADAVADGDLTGTVEVDGKCEVSLLLGALDTMKRNLAATVATVRTGTDAIALGSAEVAAGNQDLSSRTEQQASSLEETASSMEELTSTVKQNADNARQANVLAETASGVAARGGQVIGQVVDTMDQIHASSSRIVDIISVIDGIAFQTNILALNAAVEAARAGEQGRGFAVVAGEVRSLAQRSAAAAKEIKSLIDDSSSKVETGSRLVKEAGSTMGDIVDSVRRVADILGEITSASAEQSAGIEQINEAVTQMDTVTQQNAALVEEAAAAAQAMQDQAAHLAEAVAVFRVEAALAQAARPAAPREAAPRATPRSAAPAKARPALTAAKPGAAKAPARAKAEPVAAGDWEEF
jgi:methyl-accepting chemotaxis protein